VRVPVEHGEKRRGSLAFLPVPDALADRRLPLLDGESVEKEVPDRKRDDEVDGLAFRAADGHDVVAVPFVGIEDGAFGPPVAVVVRFPGVDPVVGHNREYGSNGRTACGHDRGSTAPLVLAARENDPRG